jgi:hypothetical protein
MTEQCNPADEIKIEVGQLYRGTAKLSDLHSYVESAMKIAGEGRTVVLTGEGPIWLYLKIAHALHGRARKLIYRSPVTGDLTIFDHDPF